MYKYKVEYYNFYSDASNRQEILIEGEDLKDVQKKLNELQQSNTIFSMQLIQHPNGIDKQK